MVTNILNPANAYQFHFLTRAIPINQNVSIVNSIEHYYGGQYFTFCREVTEGWATTGSAVCITSQSRISREANTPRPALAVWATWIGGAAHAHHYCCQFATTSKTQYVSESFTSSCSFFKWWINSSACSQQVPRLWAPLSSSNLKDLRQRRAGWRALNIKAAPLLQFVWLRKRVWTCWKIGFYLGSSITLWITKCKFAGPTHHVAS